MKGSLQSDTVPAPRIKEKPKSCKVRLALLLRHSEYVVSGSQNCDESCMLRGRGGAVLYRSRQVGIIKFT